MQRSYYNAIWIDFAKFYAIGCTVNYNICHIQKAHGCIHMVTNTSRLLLYHAMIKVYIGLCDEALKDKIKLTNTTKWSRFCLWDNDLSLICSTGSILIFLTAIQKLILILVQWNCHDSTVLSCLGLWPVYTNKSPFCPAIVTCTLT